MAKKKKSYDERKYNLSNAEMVELVKQFQAGSDSAGMKMLEVFENFLANFVKLLYYGTYDRSNYELKRFIGFYIPNGQLRYKFMKNQLSPPEAKAVNDVVRGLNVMVTRFCELEDVEQALKLALLSCLKIYEPRPSSQGGSVPVTNYISNYSLYIFKKVTDTQLISQLGRKTFPLIDESTTDENEVQAGFLPPIGPDLESYLDKEEFNEAWVYGTTAKGVFATLTQAERQLIKWRYIDGERASEIAHKLLEHPNTTRERLLRLKETIKEYLLNERFELESIDKNT